MGDPIHQFQIKNLFLLGQMGGHPFAFTNSALFMIIIALGIALFLLLSTSSRALVPGRLQSVAELSYEFVADTIKSTAGTEGLKFLPLVFTLFMFILVANLIGLIPYTFTITSHIIITAALALTVLGLTEAVSIARALALRTGQRIDGSQEFVGQGLSNLAGAFFSAYPSSGSFNRSGVNLEAGARTPIAAIVSAALLALIVIVIAPLGRYLPLAVMAALLFVVAFGLINVAEMRRIARTSRTESIVLAVTFLATLATPLEFAILFGVVVSLLVYLNRTTHPRLTPVLPDPSSPLRRS